MSDQPDTINRLAKRLEDLEHRVDVLEHPLAVCLPRSTPAIELASSALTTPPVNALQTASIFALLGRAMLGVAGAYLLRAAAEAGSLPKAAVAWAGIAYAFLWLVWAARTRAESSLAPPIYACTSALILGPMLWELTLSFKLFPASITGAVLGAYALAAFGLVRKPALTPVLRMSLLAAAGLSLAMAIASHAFLPFVAVLLLMVAVVEFDPWADRLAELQTLLAIAADAAIWTLIFIYFGPPAAHAEYPRLSSLALLAPGITIFLIASTGLILQTVVHRRRITIFATIQTTIAFLLAAVSLADFGPSWNLVLLGILCLFFAAAGYAAVFTLLSDTRTSTVFTTWSTILYSSGCLICFQPALAAVCLGAAAVAMTFIGRHRTWTTFEFCGALLLGFAAAESGLFAFIGRSLGSPQAGSSTLAAGLIAVCAILCYAVSRPPVGEPWGLQCLHLAVGALAVAAVAGFAVEALLALTALKVIPGAHHLAFIRTLTLCSAALALVLSGARWRRLELTRLGYSALALVAVKLVAEDLRHGHLAYIAGSIFLFAVTLIAAPRVARVRRKA